MDPNTKFSVHRRADITGRPAAYGWLICAVLVALALPTRVHAQFNGKASATGQFDSNSNVFDLAAGAAAPTIGGGHCGDTDFSYGAEFDGTYQLGRQQFFATASTKEYDYQHYSELDHSDYSLGAGLKWKVVDALNGRASVTRTHSMVPIEDLSGAVVGSSIAIAQTETLSSRPEIPLRLESRSLGRDE